MVIYTFPMRNRKNNISRKLFFDRHPTEAITEYYYDL